jgi:RNA polymerase sigma-70 factor (ECF subfamily)
MARELKKLTAEFLTNRENLMAYISAFVRQPDVAEDIFQEVWLKLAEADENGTVVHNSAAWCRGTAKNLIHMKWREKRVITDERILDTVERAFVENADNQAAAARLDALSTCLSALPEKARSLLQLRFDEGLRVTQIDEKLHKPYDSVRMMLSRFQQSLEECVRRRLAAERSGR